MKQPLLHLAAGLLLCLPTSLVRAEGSKQLTPNSNPTVALTDVANTRAGFLTHDAIGGENVSLGFLKPRSWGTTALPFTEDYRMYVRLKPGEKLYYGVHRGLYAGGTFADLILTVRYGTGEGTIVKQTTLARDQTSTGQALLDENQDGVIATAVQAQQGPNSLSPTGYRALSYTNNTGSTQDFFVEFTQTGEFTNAGSQTGFNDLGNSAGTAFTGERRSEYDFWDFTVVGTDGQEKPGRLFSRFWAFTAGTSAGTNNFLNRLSATFKMFPLVESIQNPGQYYVKEVELAGMRPLVFFYVTNAFGSSPVGGANDFPTRRKSQLTNTAYAQYPNFVNNPDETIWPSAPIPTVSVTPQPFCSNGKTQVAFTTSSAEAGQFDILIDLNGQPGYQLNSTDVLLTQSVGAGTSNTVVWNGRNGNNQDVAPTGQNINFQFTSNGAAFNFPVYDAEGNPDGFRVRNVRPANGTVYDLLYWDDSNLPATKFPAPRTELAGQRSGNTLSEGVHKWGATSDDGDQYTVNTWTYGFSAFNGATSFTYTSVCDNDGDGVADNVDIDDDNDGILDVVEALSPLNTATNTVVAASAIDPGFIETATSLLPNPPIRYLDAAYKHPVLGAFQDANNDGVNDIFDADLDGTPNHFDLDSDGDGLPDAFEANGNVNPTYSYDKTLMTESRTGKGNGGQPYVYTRSTYVFASAYDPAQSKYTSSAAATSSAAGLNAGVGPNGLPDAVENNVTYTVVRTLVGNNDGDYNESITPTQSNASKYTLADNDTDQRVSGSQTIRNFNFLDIDSDNDGITDEIEAQTTVVYTARKAQANFKTDTNRNGIRDAYDPGNGGTAIGTPVNSGGSAVADMFDFDSDGDNAGKGLLPIHQQTADWTEGFDDDQNGTAGEELVAKARAFAVANPGKAAYYAIGSPNQVLNSAFLRDNDGDKIPNFLDMDSPNYHDDNFNGLVDLFDPAYGGTPSTAPRVGGAGTEAIFRSGAKAVPLPVTLVDFKAQAVGRDALVSWTTAQEVNSASFVVERSNDGSSFVPVATLPARGTSTQHLDYRITDKNAGVQAGLRYYRLLQLDLDGTVARSDVKTVLFDGQGSATAVRLFPNPTSANVTLDLEALPTGPYRVEVLSAEGRKVAEWSANGGQQQVLPTQNLVKGVYLLRISGHNTTQVLKLVKN
ncbi:T9SS C-terminal target domain-containing protein [Hymenobacter lapidiphilus]|uniref:T9SS type A sorting domain-containing protein n=1 Tax=Hymenobacter sp. CCM 8763 TaxID=2303334 RepID=UPI000E354733|nr:T9SS type A sorting domain-containing protein [Hymenobacter sp. CCM 8763]RFP66698.1 T9SS C-terminal target domain-containing protein [Hymenobacter sp. CCM 8763]